MSINHVHQLQRYEFCKHSLSYSGKTEARLSYACHTSAPPAYKRTSGFSFSAKVKPRLAGGYMLILPEIDSRIERSAQCFFVSIAEMGVLCLGAVV